MCIRDSFGIPRPRIAVAGLNPHAGENGLFGREELDEIIPAIRAAQDEGLCVAGPVPPDSLFPKALGGWDDIVVAMYHDQGHIPLKTVGFVYEMCIRDRAKTITLPRVGIPRANALAQRSTGTRRAYRAYV